MDQPPVFEAESTESGDIPVFEDRREKLQQTYLAIQEIAADKRLRTSDVVAVLQSAGLRDLESTLDLQYIRRVRSHESQAGEQCEAEFSAIRIQHTSFDVRTATLMLAGFRSCLDQRMSRLACDKTKTNNGAILVSASHDSQQAWNITRVGTFAER